MKRRFFVPSVQSYTHKVSLLYEIYVFRVLGDILNISQYSNMWGITWQGNEGQPDPDTTAASDKTVQKS